MAIMRNLVENAADDFESRAFWLGPQLRVKFLIRWLRRIEVGQLTVVFPSGHRRVFGTSGAALQASIVVHDLRLVARMIASGDIGFAESYVAGEWETPDLTALLRLGAANGHVLADALEGSWAARVLNRIRHARRANTRRGSRRNIAAHYDLGNAFYGCWLDESMTYSAAIFSHVGEALPVAQRRKYLRLAEKLDLGPGDRVLEIGCGWGGFAEIAAGEFGCEVVCLTLSQEQADYARARMRRAGLSDVVEIRQQDYRDVAGQFDKIVSIEMFEAVGQENWQTYFAVLDRCLKAGGRAALQSITIADSHFENYRQNPDFIQCYIFPGGMLPSPRAFDAAVSRAGFRVADAYYFGRDYAETLRRWAAAFEANWPAIKELGFDERFRRLWRYYLCYCEAGFEHRQIDVGQFLIERQ
jgi:cyclopropane-fatty-acyl-phospholipid synthase